MVNVWVNDVVNERVSCFQRLSMSACRHVGEFFCMQVLLGVLVLMSE